MPATIRRCTNEEVIDAYKQTGSVWKAGKLLGVAGQSVHERLVALEYKIPSRRWTTDELDELRRLVGDLVPLGDIARRLGRPYAGVAVKASRLGIRSTPQRRKKIPRGAGYDKVSMKRNVDALWSYDGSMAQFARSRSLAIDSFVYAFQRHFPAEWARYTETHASLPRAVCPYCEGEFYPQTKKQTYCTRKCSSDARRDRDYFGGNRRDTVGLSSGICQLCGGQRDKGLSSHHMLGKENDPDNLVLIALCRGCHRMVGDLASRKFVENPSAWEALITLVWMRRHGANLAYGEALSVSVDLDVESDVYEIEEGTGRCVAPETGDEFVEQVPLFGPKPTS